MKFIKGNFKKWLKEYENYQNYKYNLHDYFLQKERNFLVTLYQVVFNEDYKNDDLSQLSKDDYLTIKKIASFNEDDAKNLTCKDMKRYIGIKHTKDIYNY